MYDWQSKDCQSIALLEEWDEAIGTVGLATAALGFVSAGNGELRWLGEVSVMDWSTALALGDGEARMLSYSPEAAHSPEACERGGD